MPKNNNRSATANYQVSRFSLRKFTRRHLQACISSFGAMSRAPLATFMTLAVIGIALALPSGLFVMLQNVKVLSGDWNNVTQISLYLKPKVTTLKAQKLLQELNLRKDVSLVRYISPEKGLKQFESYSGFSNAIAQLKSNPLPGVLEVEPANSVHSPLAIKKLVMSLRKLPQVDSARLDMDWVKRLYSMLNLGQRAVYGLGALLAFGVILIIGNTIRLTTQSHRKEIEVIKLVGGTDAFIRRPFLYSGLLYGVIGGIVAMFMLDLFISWLKPPVEHLAHLYNSSFHIHNLSNSAMLMLIFVGGLLGLAGSWLVVGQHLRQIEPE